MNYTEIKKLKRRYFKDGYLLEWREVVPVYKNYHNDFEYKSFYN